MDLFARFAAAGYGADLLPVIPPGATLHDSPKGPPMPGKSPGRFWDGKWGARAGWREYTPNAADLRLWHRQGANVGLKADRWPGVDIDIANTDLAAAVRVRVMLELGDTAVRVGRAPRCLLPYKLTGEPFRKKKLTLTGPDGVALGAVEILAAGQQYVVGGIHPATKKPFTWKDGDLADWAGALPEISEADVEALLDGLTRMLAGLKIKAELAKGTDLALAGINQEALRAPSYTAVSMALKALPNDVDYDGWICVGRAIKAACTGLAECELFGDDGLELWTDWSGACTRPFDQGHEPASAEQCEAKWSSFTPPHALGWRYLAENARPHGFMDAVYEFDVVPKPERPDDEGPGGPAGGGGGGGGTHLTRQGYEAIRDDLVWVRGLDRMYRRSTGELLNQRQVDGDYPQLGPAGSSKSAWARLIASYDLRRVSGLTYRPGGEPFRREAYGECVNTYVPPDLGALAPSCGDPAPWIDRWKEIIPEPREHEHAFDMMAWMLQRPDVKVGHALLIYSPGTGTGKDLLTEPLQHGVGTHNYGIVTSTQLQSQFNGWIANKRLIVCSEAHAFQRIETMQKLKGFLAGLPATVTVNKKNQPEYDVPNIANFIFFTNLPDALAIEENDRRFMVVSSPAEHKDQEYFTMLAAWLKAGGNRAAIDWLMARDISRFSAYGRAPETAAKDAMRNMTRRPFDRWLLEMIRGEDAPFDQDIVSVRDVRAAVPRAFERDALSSETVAHALKRIGAVPRGQYRVGDERQSLYVVRRRELYENVDDTEIAERYRAALIGRKRDAFR